MENKIKIYVRGDGWTPKRFWELALSTGALYSRRLNELGFVFSESKTKEYINLSEEDKKKVQFKVINDKEIKY